MRAFVAVNLDRPLRDELVEMQENLAQSVKGFRWVKGELLHITLSFLGELEPSGIARIAGKLEQAGHNTAPFKLSFAGIGAFPGIKQPRVIWIGVKEGAARLSGLAREVYRALGEKGPFSFTPHLTLGRAKKNETPYLPPYLLDSSRYGSSSLQVNSFSLMQSSLYASGPVYQELKKFLLKDCNTRKEFTE